MNERRGAKAEGRAGVRRCEGELETTRTESKLEIRMISINFWRFIHEKYFGWTKKNVLKNWLKKICPKKKFGRKKQIWSKKTI